MMLRTKDGNTDKTIQFMLASGMNSSALEHSVPEQLFSTSTTPAEGISAVKALKIANDQGMPIYTISQTNIATILPQLQIDAQVKADIQNAVNAGKIVTMPKTNIAFNGWNGCGYIIVDPQTGSGAYMIGGGLSGGQLVEIAFGLLWGAMFLAAFAGGLAGGGTANNMPQNMSAKSTYSAWATVFTRIIVIVLAKYLEDTPYVWGGELPQCGFDCSGFIHYVFTTVYGKNVFGGQRLSASGQHQYLVNKGWTYLYSEKLHGDILWSIGYGHTGIYLGDEKVIHASGKPCATPNDPTGWLPDESLPAECRQTADTQIRICGKYKRVITTPVTSPWFAYNGGIAVDIGRPSP